MQKNLNEVMPENNSNINEVVVDGDILDNHPLNKIETDSILPAIAQAQQVLHNPEMAARLDEIARSANPREKLNEWKDRLTPQERSQLSEAGIV